MTFAAALVGRLKAEARESKATREDFFAQLLHDNLKAAIWQRALLRNIFRGVFFSVRFFLQCLHFNMRMRYRDSMRKAKAAGEKEKPDSMLRVCNFCMQLFFFSSVLWHSFAGSSWNWIHQYWMTSMSLQCGNRQLELWTCFCCQWTSDVNLTVTCDVCCSAGNFVVFGQSCNFCQCLVTGSGDSIHVQISKYNKLKI